MDATLNTEKSTQGGKNSPCREDVGGATARLQNRQLSMRK